MKYLCFLTVTLGVASTLIAQMSEDEAYRRLKQADGRSPSVPAQTQPEGPICFPIPLEGRVGTHIRLESLRTCFQKAVDTKADIIVLEISSGGGAVDEMFRVSDFIADFRKTVHTPVVAHCHKAYSAAAIIAMACDKIYIDPKAAIGAAMEIELGSDGQMHATDENRVGKKYESADRGHARSIAESAGHSGLIVDAMMTLEAELWLARTPVGKPLLFASLPEATQAGFNNAKQIDSPTTLLTLSANQAVDVGLADGKASDLAEVCAGLGLRHCHVDGTGRRFMAHVEDTIAENSRLLARIKTSYGDIFLKTWTDEYGQDHSVITEPVKADERPLKGLLADIGRLQHIRKESPWLSNDDQKALEGCKADAEARLGAVLHLGPPAVKVAPPWHF